MTVQLTIIGLGKVGASIGLALSDQTKQITRVGHDIDPNIAQEAHKLGAVDSIQRNLFKAIEGTDIVVLAIPVDQVVETLALIKDDLREDTVIIDTAPLKKATMDWAEQNLPEKIHYLSMMPTLNADLFNENKPGIKAANKDMFKNSLMVIAVPGKTESDALALASNLSVMLGASPFYADAVESDGLMTGNHVLPQLMAAALINSLSKQPGWLEGRKLTDKPFFQATLPVTNFDDKVRLGESMINNQENTVRQLNYLIAELIEYRDALAEKDTHTLQSAFEKARDERLLWLSRRLENNWQSGTEKPELPSAKDMFSQLFGFGRRNKKDKA
jgi:prephenate dehydrogenase